jgi:Protein of unknown function (DUF1488)
VVGNAITRGPSDKQAAGFRQSRATLEPEFSKLQTRKDSSMPLKFVRSQGHQFKTQTVRFIVSDGEKEIQCAVSDTAMDDAERATGIHAHERDSQFERLRDRIVESAAGKWFAGNIEPGEPRILVKRADLVPG